MIFERVKWSALILWCAAISAAAIMFASVPLWFAALVLIAWLGIFVRFWPEEDE